AGEERCGSEYPGRGAEGERNELAAEEHRPDHAGDERQAGPVAKREDAAQDGTDAVDGEDHRPVARAAEILLRVRRSEHRPEHEEEGPEPEDHDPRPQPRPRRETA